MSWSPDSTQIAYTSALDDAGQTGSAVRVRNIVSGEDRELYRSATRVYCKWEVRHPNLFCTEGPGALISPFFGTAQTGEALSVALDSGRVERLGSIPAGSGADTLEQFTRERGIELIPEVRIIPGMPDSPFRVVNRRDLEIRPTPGRDWKHLVSFNADLLSYLFGYSPDGKWIFYGDKDSAGKDSLFRVSSAGGQPERLGELPAQHGGRQTYISPDGRNILIEGNASNTNEYWLLENFVPRSPAAR